MLNSLPSEILYKILNNLNKKDIYRLIITNHSLYKSALPYLYRHVELCKHDHTRQLKEGVKLNPFLKNVVQNYTQHLSLLVRFDQKYWNINDIVYIFGSDSPVEVLNFSHCNDLTLTTINHITSLFPNLYQLNIEYSTIDTYPSIPSPTLLSFPHILQLSLNWTEFTEDAILSFATYYPRLTHLQLGPNRAKHDLSQTQFPNLLLNHYRHLTHLSIALPQISNTSLCDLVVGYNQQLQMLSIRCTDLVLETIASHAVCLTQLTARVDPDGWIGLALIRVMERCRALSRIEISSTVPLDHVLPDFVWESMAADGKSRLRERARLAIERKGEVQGFEKVGLVRPYLTPPDYEFENIENDPIWDEADVLEVLLKQRHIQNSIRNCNKKRGNSEKIIIDRQTLRDIINISQIPK